jgi:hypothetical protein
MASTKLGRAGAPREQESSAMARKMAGKLARETSPKVARPMNRQGDRNSDDAAYFAMIKAGLKRKPKLGPVQYARRFALEKARQQKRYCDAFALWRTCGRKSCRRKGECSGDQYACLKRALDRVPHRVQWRARQDILEATPFNIGGPERAARQCMPRDFYE